MTEVARPDGRRRYGWRGIPWWTALALPLVLLGGVALARTSTSVPHQFGPRAGVPDSLRELRLPVPRTPLAIQPPRYLERAVEKKDSATLLVESMADRYHITNAMARMVHDAAVEVGLDPELGFRLVRVESVFDPDAVGAGGAAGLVQMMPGTARTLDPSVDTRRELMDPRTNMRLGFGYLRDMIERYEEHGADAVRLGVLAYNRGEVAVDRALRRGRDPENGYGRRILGPRAHGGREYRGRGIRPVPPRPDTARADGVSRRGGDARGALRFVRAIGGQAAWLLSVRAMTWPAFGAAPIHREPMTNPFHEPDPELRARLERAAAGLTYGSEGDSPFEFFILPGAGDRPPGPDAFARLVGAPEDAPRAERDLERFFARHIERADPADAPSQALRPRYEALRETLRTALRWTTVYRVGEVEVQCYVVGGDGRGNLVGLRTVALET